MKRLHRKVNIVVVIAKADTLTATEISRLKQNILNDIKDNDIQVRIVYCRLYSVLFTHKLLNRKCVFDAIQSSFGASISNKKDKSCCGSTNF